MSANDALLIFLDAHGEQQGWLRLAGGTVVARGTDEEGMPALVDPENGEALRVAAIVPGDSVALHWLELPAGLAPAQAAAAARLAAAEVSAQPLADMHVAVGREAEGEETRAVAIVPSLAMVQWIGRLQARALDPDIMLSEPLLLAAPTEGFVRFDRGEIPLWRGRSDAFAIEPALAELVLDGSPITTLDRQAFEDGLGAAIADPAVNLRQGAFAKRKRWKIDWPTVRRLAVLALAILLVTLLIQIALILRYSAAADAMEAETAMIAERVLPGEGEVADPTVALTRRLADLRGSGVGYRAIAAVLFDAVRATPNAELQSLTFDRDGSLRATVQADSDATLAALQDRVRAAGLAVEAGAPRSGGGRQIADIIVRGS